jgi:hypothetical protein
MSTTTTTTPPTISPTAPGAAAPVKSSLATSVKFKAFVIVFSTAFPVLYLIFEKFNLPLFTFHPATNRVELFYAPPRSGEGPTMYWYGWTAMCLIAGSTLGALATMLPDGVVKKIPLFLAWLFPILVLFPLAYGLMPFWTK